MKNSHATIEEAVFIKAEKGSFPDEKGKDMAYYKIQCLVGDKKTGFSAFEASASPDAYDEAVKLDGMTKIRLGIVFRAKSKIQITGLEKKA